jgi:hypothetical protein
MAAELQTRAATAAERERAATEACAALEAELVAARREAVEVRQAAAAAVEEAMEGGGEAGAGLEVGGGGAEAEAEAEEGANGRRPPDAAPLRAAVPPRCLSAARDAGCQASSSLDSGTGAESTASMASQASQAVQTVHAAHAAHAAQIASAPEGSTHALRHEIAELQALRNELVEAHHRQRVGAGVGEAERRLQAQQQQQQQQQQTALELQRQVAATEAWQQGLHAAGGQLVARMTWLQDDIAARCRAVEANARDDVRRGFVACTPDPAMRERVAALVAGQE